MKSQSELMRISDDCLRRYLCVVTFLLPFMFGCQLMATEEPNLPTDVLVWILLGFTPSAPAFLAPLFSVTALVWAVFAYGVPRRDNLKGLWSVCAWFGVALAGVVGLEATTECDYALNWILHFLGAGTFGLAVWWTSRHDPLLLRSLMGAVACGTLVLSVYAVYQRLGGVESQLLELERQHREQFGESLPAQMAQKLQQLRVNSFFSDPNLFAAHLLVTFPSVLCWIWGLCRRRGARVIATSLAALVLLVVFCWTGSRGGLMGLLVGLAAGAWCLPWLQARRWRWLLPVLAGLLVIGIWQYAVHVQAEGRVSSASVRLGYYRVAWHMLKEAPLTGRGLGEFYPWYVRLKPYGAELSRDAHSFVAAAASQCGVPGLLAVLLVLSLPWVVVFHRTHWRLAGAEMTPETSQGVWSCLILAGGAGWTVHALFQFNELVPGTVYLLTFLPLLWQAQDDDDVLTSSLAHGCRWPVWRWLALLPAVACFVMAGWKLPGESDLQTAFEEQSQQQRLLADIRQLKAQGQDVRSMEQMLADRHQALMGQLEELCREVPRAPAPCRMLLKMQKRDILGAWSTGRAPAPELLEKCRKTAKQLVDRTPHRASSWLELAWAEAAAGDWESMKNSLAQAWCWFPGDGMADVLLPVYAQRRPELLVALADVRAKVDMGADGERVVRLYHGAALTDAQLSEFFAPSMAEVLTALGGPGKTRYEFPQGAAE